jgi:hypothetical protein
LNTSETTGEENDDANNCSDYRHNDRGDACALGFSRQKQSHDAEDERYREQYPATMSAPGTQANTDPMMLTISAISPMVLFRFAGACGPTGGGGGGYAAYG